MKFLRAVLLIIILLVLGFYLNKDFINYSFSMLHINDVIVINRIALEEFYKSLLFPITLGILPLFYLLLYKITKVRFLYNGLLATLIIVGMGVLFWRLRIFGLNVEFKALSEIDYPVGQRPNIAINYFKFEIYLFMGFIVGTLMSILFFRDKSKSLLN